MGRRVALQGGPGRRGERRPDFAAPPPTNYVQKRRGQVLHRCGGSSGMRRGSGPSDLALGSGQLDAKGGLIRDDSPLYSARRNVAAGPALDQIRGAAAATDWE